MSLGDPPFSEERWRRSGCSGEVGVRDKEKRKKEKVWWESFHHVGSGPGGQILVVRFNSKCLHLLSSFASSPAPSTGQVMPGFEPTREGGAQTHTSCKIYIRLNHEGT